MLPPPPKSSQLGVLRPPCHPPWPKNHLYIKTFKFLEIETSIMLDGMDGYRQNYAKSLHQKSKEEKSWPGLRIRIWIRPDPGALVGSGF